MMQRDITGRPIPVDEIVEEDVETIHYDMGYGVTEDDPHAGRVKWFRDELDQLWFKFDVRSAGEYENRVLPASACRAVIYRKEHPFR